MRALLSLSGSLPAPAELLQLRYDTVIAADGSAWQLLERGIVPHLIVGDLDSLQRLPNPEQAFPQSEILHIPDQDSTDFEKALRIGLDRGIAEFVIVGMHGGELDHTLNNWSVFLRYSQQAVLELYEHGRCARAVFSSLALATVPGEMISLIPQPRARLTTRGLVWDLNDEVLELGRREGARNQARQPLVEVELYEGSLLVFSNAATR
jgi:thiamine pyrophosphokinase